MHILHTPCTWLVAICRMLPDTVEDVWCMIDFLYSNIVREDGLFSCCWPESSPWPSSVGPPGAPSAARASAHVACRAGERGADMCWCLRSLVQTYFMCSYCIHCQDIPSQSPNFPVSVISFALAPSVFPSAPPSPHLLIYPSTPLTCLHWVDSDH